MAYYVDLIWNPQDSGLLSQKDRRPGRYQAYVPDPLGGQLPNLGPEASEAADAALTVLVRADEQVGAKGGYLNHLLIRSESISSSWIEGNRITPKKLAIAELLKHGSSVALDVVANVVATEDAIAELADRTKTVSAADIVRLQHVIEPRLTQGLRTEQNWVGGPGWSPLRAEFAPPPASEVERLVDDLARFVTDTSGNPIVRTAVAHAQFETIHPFIDGNGRTGRALIHTVLKRTDTLRNTLIPISTVFAGDTNAYIAGLTAFRQDPSRIDDWIIGFARATELAAANAVQLATRVAVLDAETERTLLEFRAARGIAPVRPRSDAVSLRILGKLALVPVLTVENVVETHGVSTTAAHRALVELADAGILQRTKDGRGKLLCWTADRYLDLVALTERSNRVGGRDTASIRPRLGPPRPN